MSLVATGVTIGHYNSPIGVLELQATKKGIYQIKFVESEQAPETNESSLHDAIDRLHAYFQGDPSAFVGMKLAMHGTDFSQTVWDHLLQIPYGQTVTYTEIAERIKNPKAVRAVGTAVGNNPLAIVVPCHRVLPATGDIGNYNAGPWRKEWLLQHESAH